MNKERAPIAALMEEVFNNIRPEALAESEEAQKEIAGHLTSLIGQVEQIEDYAGRRDLELKITRATMRQLDALSMNAKVSLTPIDMMRVMKDFRSVIEGHNSMLETLARV